MIESLSKEKTTPLSSHSTTTLKGFTITGKSNGFPQKQIYNENVSCQMGVFILLCHCCHVKSLFPNASKLGLLSQARLQICD